MIKITVKEGRAFIVSPYNPNFTSRIKRMGGKWDSARKMWSIDERNVDAVRQVLREIYGMDDTPTELVSVRVKTLVSIYADRGPITIFGRVVANATGRDSGARIGEGVVFITGNAKSGGSTKYWETIISEDSEFIIHDVPRTAVLEGFDTYDSDAIKYEIIEPDKPNYDALRAEKERLLARISEIDIILKTEI
jgi:hypothetical protein